MAEEKCMCFPESKELKKQYFKEMNDRYLAEKTWPTIDSRASGKCFRDIGAISAYAAADYIYYVCKNNKTSCPLAKMSTDIHYKEVSKTLNKIKFEGQCPK